MKLNGKRVVVTGASRGLGLALSQALARRGAGVVMVARAVEPLQAAVQAVSAAGGEAHAIALDVSKARSIYPLAAQAAELLGGVDILINNASTLGAVPLRSLLETECEDMVSVLETNTVGPFRLTKAMLGPMLLRGEGLIVNISSDAARQPYPTWGAYSLSKAALEQMTAVWKSELEGTGVDFLCVDPGEMDTRMHADAMPEADTTTLASPNDVADRILDRIEGEKS